MKGLRASALLVVLTMLTVACGARFSEQERQLIISGGPGAGAPGTPAVDATAGGPTTGSTGGGTPGGGDGPGAAVASPDGTGSGGSGDGDGTGGSAGTGGGQDTSDGSGGSGGSGGSDGGSDGAGQADGGSQDGGGGTTNTQAAPPEGNGGATDVGITGDRIVISNVSSITGAVPGLFEPSQKAVTAYIARFNATEGTVYGRSIELINRDSKMDAQENRRQYLAACEDSFAAVGSMSAFAFGAVQPIRDCGIPDLRTAAVAEGLQNTPNVYAADASNSSAVGVGDYQYYKEQVGSAVERAGAVHINNQVTQYQTGRTIEATSKIGFNWIKKIPVSLSETNYSPIVLELQDAGVEFVYFQGAYQQAVRLAEAMQQQNYEPAMYILQANAYNRNLLASGGDAVQGVHIGVPSILLSQQNAELDEYRRWLQQVDPDARPTGLGMYSWSAAKLFVRALKEIGPRPTRQKLLNHLSQVDGYEGGGLIPPQAVGAKQPSPCFQIVRVQGDRFQPRTDGFRCGRVVSTG